jgi:hypothetical protein
MFKELKIPDNSKYMNWLCEFVVYAYTLLLRPPLLLLLTYSY